MCIRDRHWDQYARGTIVGITRGTNKNHIIRATLESIDLQVCDVIDAMRADAGVELKSLKMCIRDSTMCDQFNELHPNWDITFNYGVCTESDEMCIRDRGYRCFHRCPSA